MGLIEQIEGALRFTESTHALAKVFVRTALVSAITLAALMCREKMCAIVSLTGALFDTASGIVFPAAFYMKLYWKQLHSVKVALLSLMFTGGVVLQVVSTASAIRELLQ